MIHAARRVRNGAAASLKQYNVRTVEPGAAEGAKYARRLHAYAWALERAAADGLRLAPVVRMGLLCLDPVRLQRFVPGEQARMLLRPRWIEVERHDAAFGRFLGEVMQLVARDEPPPGAQTCACCRYHARRRELDPAYHHDGLPF